MNVAVIEFLLPLVSMGITGAGFINKAATKYSTAIGQNPLKRKIKRVTALTQKTEKSKYSANPRPTHNMIPFQERYTPRCKMFSNLLLMLDLFCHGPI